MTLFFINHREDKLVSNPGLLQEVCAFLCSTYNYQALNLSFALCCVLAMNNEWNRRDSYLCGVGDLYSVVTRECSLTKPFVSTETPRKSRPCFKLLCYPLLELHSAHQKTLIEGFPYQLVFILVS